MRDNGGIAAPERSACWACNRPATHVVARADFGAPEDKYAVCDADDCQPDKPGERWNHYHSSTYEPYQRPKKEKTA